MVVSDSVFITGWFFVCIDRSSDMNSLLLFSTGVLLGFNISEYLQHEGFVIRTKDHRELKIKSPYYLVTKFFGRKTQKRLEKLFGHPKKSRKSLMKSTTQS